MCAAGKLRLMLIKPMNRKANISKARTDCIYISKDCSMLYYTCTYTVYPHVWRCLRACVCEGMAMCTRVYLRVASHLFSACLCVKVCVLVGLCVYRCISKRNRQKERD